ncbi:hypothetical protein E2P81_ATG08090 [Venturia nashicola]|nr:hypothetical protein E2P81_ATG08090 [Venturia nashicola]
MSQPPIPPSLTEFQIDKSVMKQVRQWVSTATWLELLSSIPDPVPDPPQPWHKTHLEPESMPLGRRASICTSADVETQKAVLWEQMAPIAMERFDFVPRDHEFVRSPNRKFVFDTCGNPFLILPIEFENLKDAVNIGYKSLWLRDGWGVYTNEAIELSGSVIFYYMRAYIPDRDDVGQKTT